MNKQERLRQKAFKLQMEEKAARKSHAWGIFAAEVRTRNLREELLSLSPEKRAARLEAAGRENERGFYVG